MKLPYFPFYPGEWLRSPTTMGMTLAEQGAYLRLLSVQWEDGFIDPEDVPMILGMSEADTRKMLDRRVWKKAFPEIEGGMLQNPRLDRDRNSALSKAESASASAHARWRKHKDKGSPVTPRRSAEEELQEGIALATEARGESPPPELADLMSQYMLLRRKSKGRSMWAREQWAMNLDAEYSYAEWIEGYKIALRSGWGSVHPKKQSSGKRRTNVSLKSLENWVNDDNGTY